MQCAVSLIQIAADAARTPPEGAGRKAAEMIDDWPTTVPLSAVVMFMLWLWARNKFVFTWLRWMLRPLQRRRDRKRRHAIHQFDWAVDQVPTLKDVRSGINPNLASRDMQFSTPPPWTPQEQAEFDKRISAWEAEVLAPACRAVVKAGCVDNVAGANITAVEICDIAKRYKATR